MRLIAFIIVIVSCFHPLCATLQMSEVIYVNGEKRLLYSLPLNQKCPAWDSIISQTDGADGLTSLARGYVGFWKIVNDSLFLDSICAPINGLWRKLHIDRRVLCYDNVHRGYFAHWVENNLDIAWGSQLWMNHIGWEIVYESEADYFVKNGVVKLRRFYENKWVCKSGANGRNVYSDLLKLFPFDRFPEFKDSTKIVFMVKHIDVGRKESIKGCEIEILGKRNGNQLSAVREKELKRVLENILQYA